MKNRYKLGITYSEITPESAEHGDFSDTGWERMPEPATLRDIVNALEDHNGYIENFHPDWTHQDLYTGYNTIDYSTSTERGYCIHVEPADRRQKYHKRSMHWLNKVIAAKLRG